jgi:hypothetical protein
MNVQVDHSRRDDLARAVDDVVGGAVIETHTDRGNSARGKRNIPDRVQMLRRIHDDAIREEQIVTTVDQRSNRLIAKTPLSTLVARPMPSSGARRASVQVGRLTTRTRNGGMLRSAASCS